MTLFRMAGDTFERVAETTFPQERMQERGHLQRLLRADITVLNPDLMVVTEEFGEWEDSNRRIDLLCLDKQGRLVVVELKRGEDGGHMELQAIRYASMVSSMTFERAEQIHGQFLSRMGQLAEEAQSRMLTYLGWDEPDEENFAKDVRIVLVSEDFGKELTTAVFWLRDHDIDIRCIRLRPYRDRDSTLIDVQQIIPLPEAHEYQVQLREKEQVGRKKRAERYDVRQRFWEGLVAVARSQNTRHANIKPGSYHWLGAGSGIGGLGFNYAIVQEFGVAELYIDRGDATENKCIFDQLCAQKEAIENAFGGTLHWSVSTRNAPVESSTLSR